ncbi:MAG TPA: glycogen-binding domain-containing protein [Pyrinomonadaceae bacterium]|nr:glycogen-binding domain-containing protein [Pyrinomonadaceae bacterium]
MKVLLALGIFLFAFSFYPASAQTPQQTVAAAGDRSKANAEALKKYAGRYELETGIIPVSTLDVSFDGELWMKPSNVKKRRLVHKSKATFTDELEGTPVTFGRDDEGRVVSLTFLYEGEPYTARRIELPPPSLKGNTTFRLAGHADASVVVLTGTFNEWNQSQLVFGREGDAWVCRIDLDPGVYQYKFVVDGNWLLDPSNPETAEDEAGNVNNVIEVKPKP